MYLSLTYRLFFSFISFIYLNVHTHCAKKKKTEKKKHLLLYFPYL